MNRNVKDFDIDTDPDLDPCPKGSEGKHSQSWQDGERCEFCGAGSVQQVEMEAIQKTPPTKLGAFRPTDNMPLDRGGRKHVRGMGCWCHPEMKYDIKTFSMLVKHKDVEAGVKGET